MSSYAWTLRALDHEARESKQAIVSQIQSLLNAGAAPSDSDIAALANRHAIATATAFLLEVLRPYVTNANDNMVGRVLSLFLPQQQNSDLLTYKCAIAFQCFARSGAYTPDPLGRLRARKDLRATLALYASGHRRDWRRADKAARAILTLQRLVPASIAARGHHG